MKKLLFLFFFTVFLIGCDIEGTTKAQEDLHTLVSYFEKLSREDLSKIIDGYGLEAAIIYKDRKGNIHKLTFRNCYYAVKRDYKDSKFAKQFCNYLLHTALRKVLENRQDYLKDEIELFIDEYRKHLEIINQRNYLIIKYFKYAAFITALLVGFFISIFVYKLFGISEKEKEAEQKLKQIASKAERILIESEKQKEQLIEEGRKESQNIITQAKQQAKDILETAKREFIRLKEEGYQQGYKEGKEKHKRELKSLRKELAATKQIFKDNLQLQEIFKKITGWDYETWLRKIKKG